MGSHRAAASCRSIGSSCQIRTFASPQGNDDTSSVAVSAKATTPSTGAADIAAVQHTIEAILKAALLSSPGGVTSPWVLVLAL